MTKYEQWKLTWNKVIDIRFKYLIYVSAVVLFIIFAFYMQTKLQADLRVNDLATNAYESCLTRVDTRNTVRTLLNAVYTDVLHILPDSEQAQRFADLGLTRIDSLYPALDPLECVKVK